MEGSKSQRGNYLKIKNEVAVDWSCSVNSGLCKYGEAECVKFGPELVMTLNTFLKGGFDM
jgi:hypothetical protein